jgi:hypothetical protein
MRNEQLRRRNTKNRKNFGGRGIEQRQGIPSWQLWQHKSKHDLNVLKVVATWEDSVFPPNEPKAGTSDASTSDGIMVDQITLRRRASTGASVKSDSFRDYGLREYPLNVLLNASENNPIMKQCGEDEIRYFHFPANDMAWVEVRLTSSLLWMISLV